MKPRTATTWLFTLILLTGFSAQSMAQVTCSAPYFASDITINGTSVWVTGKNNEHGDGVFNYINNQWRYYQGAIGTKIDVTNDNRPIVTDGHMIYEWRNGMWQTNSANNKDIACSHANGLLYRTDGTMVYQYVGNTWAAYPLPPIAPMHISMDRFNKMYAVNGAGFIYQQNGNNWQQMGTKLGKEIMAADDGTVWMVSTEWNNNGYKIYKWVNNGWIQHQGSANSVAGGTNGELWIIDSAGNLHKWTGKLWQKMSLNQIGANNGGNTGGDNSYTGPTAYTIPDAEINKRDRYGNTFLWNVVSRGNTTELITYLGRGGNLNSVNNAGKNALWQAVDKRQPQMITMMLQNNMNANHQDTSRQTALVYAVNKGYTAEAEALVNGGANANTGNPLDIAVRKNNTALISLLLHSGANGGPSLLTAAKMNKTETFVLLVENGARMQRTDPKVLDYAIRNNNRKMVKYAVRVGSNPNKALDYAIPRNYDDVIMECMNAKGVDQNKIVGWAVKNNKQQVLTDAITTGGASPDQALKFAIAENKPNMATIAMNNGAAANNHIGAASASGNVQIVELLLANGADPNRGLDSAVMANQTQTAEKLLEFGANAQEPKHMKVAASKGNKEMVSALINYGGDPNAGLKAAIEGNHVPVAQFLLEKGADASDPELMAVAGGKGQTQVIEMLLARGADANNGMLGAVMGNHTAAVGLLLDNGATATNADYINTACQKGNKDIVKMLLDKGADANNGMKAAVGTGKADLVTMLIQYGADAKKEEYVLTAVNFSHTKVLELLVAEGAPTSYVSSKGETLLHIACSKRSTGIANVLIKAGLDVNAVDSKNNTPLHNAASSSKNNIDLCTLLIENNARVNAVNDKGDSVLEVARGSKLKKYLKGEGAVKYKN